MSPERGSEQRRYFILLPGAVYAYGPTTKGYSDTVAGAEAARCDAADAWDVDPGVVEVWPANPSEYGRGR